MDAECNGVPNVLCAVCYGVVEKKCNCSDECIGWCSCDSPIILPIGDNDD